MTLADMEKKASDAFDSRAIRLIRGQPLVVERCLNAKNTYYFEYKWGKNVVSRDVAQNVLVTA